MSQDLLERLRQIGVRDPHVSAGIRAIAEAHDPERIAEVLVEVIASLSADRDRLLGMATAAEERRAPPEIQVSAGMAELLAARRVVEAAKAMLPHVEMRRKAVPVDYTPVAKNLDKIIESATTALAAYDEVTR